MFWITEDAVVVCRHQLGRVTNLPSQHWLTVASRPLLVEPDPVGRPISGCPNYGPSIKPCTATLQVRGGYSDWVHVDGRAVCLDTVTGFTDGTPPGIVKYIVREPGQQWVEER